MVSTLSSVTSLWQCGHQLSLGLSRCVHFCDTSLRCVCDLYGAMYVRCQSGGHRDQPSCQPVTRLSAQNYFR